VTSEIGNIDDVSEVRVDLAAGLVTVHSAGPLGIDAVRAAVDEAGYALAAQV
jgi:copper chaperone CopZ